MSNRSAVVENVLQIMIKSYCWDAGWQLEERPISRADNGEFESRLRYSKFSSTFRSRLRYFEFLYNISTFQSWLRTLDFCA